MLTLRGRLIRPAAAVAALLACMVSAQASASEYQLLSASVQARIGERTVLGQQSPESFIAYDLRGYWRTPVEYRLSSGMLVGARLLGSVGLFEGPEKTAGAASLIPLLAVGSGDRRYALDGGAGLALLSAHRYGTQDFGGPLQFALTVGLEAPVYRRIGFTYRFMHYSDAGAYGPHTIGADLHMAGFSYRF